LSNARNVTTGQIIWTLAALAARVFSKLGTKEEDVVRFVLT
jgi:hypothetical protein